MNTISSAGRLRGVQNGIWTLDMQLKSDIPLSVKLMSYYLRMYYALQMQIYFRCELLGHQAVDCSADGMAQVNLFLEEDFPDVGCS